MPNMYTTQIYLTPEMHQQISLVAMREKKPKAEIIRRLISQGIKVDSQKNQPKNSGQALVDLAKAAEKMNLTGPKDLSINHDKYTWDE